MTIKEVDELWPTPSPSTVEAAVKNAAFLVRVAARDNDSTSVVAETFMAPTPSAGFSTHSTLSATVGGLNSKMQGSDERRTYTRDASSGARPTPVVTVSSISISMALLSVVLARGMHKIRMHRTRRTWAAVQIQAKTRGRSMGRRLRAARWAATLITRCWLLHAHNKWAKLAELQAELRAEQAAVHIQSGVRAWRVVRVLYKMVWRNEEEEYPFWLIGDDFWLDKGQVMAALKQERRATVRIQAAIRGYRVRADLRAPTILALRAALGGQTLSSVIYLCTMVARGFFGCLLFDRAGRMEGPDELIKRHGGKVKKAGSAKKQRARKAVHGSRAADRRVVMKTQSGDWVCAAGPGAVDVAFLYKAAHRKTGRLVLTAVDKHRLSYAGVRSRREEEELAMSMSMTSDEDAGGEWA
jgi:hypothetical protein